MRTSRYEEDQANEANEATVILEPGRFDNIESAVQAKQLCCRNIQFEELP